MRWLRKLVRRATFLLDRSREERAMDDELRFHLEREAEALEREEGLSPAEARREARVRFGGTERWKERAREARGAGGWDALVQDVRYAARTVRRAPGFSAVVLTTLALGIGATTAVFSVVDGVLLRPLPYEDPGELVFLWGVERGMRSGSSWASHPDYVDFEERNGSFAELAAVSTGSFATDDAEGRPTRVTAAFATHDLFRTLGVEPELGRGIAADEDRPGAGKVAVLSHGYWASRFGSGPAVVGASIRLDGEPYTVVGVMPPGFDFPGDVRLWVPLVPTFGEDQRGQHRILPVARIADGTTLQEAESEIVAIARALEKDYPATNTRRSARLESLRETFVGDVRPTLLAVLGVVGLVLLVACANVANLMLARASNRSREVAIRGAMGAGRSRIGRQLLTESLVLATAGGALGVVVAVGGVRLLRALDPGDLPRMDAVTVDLRVLGFAAAVTLVTGLLFGLAPLVRLRGTEHADALREGGRTEVGGGSGWLARGVVALEVTLAVVAVSGAALLGRSFLSLQSVDPGFDPTELVAVRVTLPETAYPMTEAERVESFHREAARRLESIPGVRSAAAGYRHPLDGGWETSFVVPGVIEPQRGERPEARLRPVTPGYFETAGITLRRGRAFTRDDGPAGPGVAVINESFARDIFGGEDPLGHRIVKGPWWPGRPGEFEIVGVVGDVKMDGLDTATPWAMYFPHAQMPFNEMYHLVRAGVEPGGLYPAIRREIWELDPELPLDEIVALEEIRRESLATDRFRTAAVGAFGLLALILAAVGIYGVLAYSVARRSGEIGVRMALGARPGGVLRTVVGEGMVLAGAGLGLGLVGAMALGRLLETLLFRVEATDPAALGATAGALALAALAACVVPALRATRVDPMTALRVE